MVFVVMNQLCSRKRLVKVSVREILFIIAMNQLCHRWEFLLFDVTNQLFIENPWQGSASTNRPPRSSVVIKPLVRISQQPITTYLLLIVLQLCTLKPESLRQRVMSRLFCMYIWSCGKGIVKHSRPQLIVSRCTFISYVSDIHFLYSCF